MVDDRAPRQHEDRTLELDESAMRKLVAAVLERAVDHIGSLSEQPGYVDTREAVARSKALKEPAPSEGTPLSTLLDELFDRHALESFTTAGPGYLAYVPGGGLFHAAAADLIANTINRYTGVLAAAPGLVALEANVVRWFGEFVGYPATASGYLTSGGSLANLGALVTARVARLGEEFLDGTLYVSDQVHHCVAKAARLAGVPRRNVRILPTDTDYRLSPKAVAAALDADRQRGLRPFMVVGSAGTTNTGAVDPLLDLAELAERERLWFHVDGAYGGFFAMTDRGKRILEGIDRADSIALDPHKTLFLPYGTGALLVKDRDALEQAHSEHADYMPEMQHDADLADPCEISPELSKPFRGLRVWLPFKMHGVESFRNNLEEKLDLALWIADRIRQHPDLEVLAEPQLSTLAFAIRAGKSDLDRVNRLTEALHRRVNAAGRVHLTSTRLGERYAIRICVVSFRTHADRMEACLEDITTAAAEVLANP